MATNNFGFLQLTGSDTAGHNSINALITSIDTELATKGIVSGMIMLHAGPSTPPGWVALNNTTPTTPSLQDMITAFGTPPSPAYWIKKV